MYRVMIVEDEMLVRIGLKNSVDWNKFGMQLAADFPDGQAAWDYYERERPEVVITDIRMPKMDGMELIANIRARDKDTQVVVLTCLEEFELARKAMSLGVSSYILKLTMTEEEIEGALNAAKQQLERQESQWAPGKDALRTNSGDMELIKEKMFKDFLFYNIFSAEEFGRFVERSGMKLSSARLVCCMMEVDRYARLKAKFQDANGHLIKMTLLNILGEITASCKRGEAFHLGANHFALVLHYEDMLSEQAVMQETHSILSRIQDVIETYFNGSVSFGVSGIRNGYEALPKLYAEAQRALERKFAEGPGLRHAGSRPADMTAVRERVGRMRTLPAVRELLPAHKRKEYDGYLDYFEYEFAGDRKSAETMLFRLAQWIGANLDEDDPSGKDRLLRMTEQLEECDTLPDMLDRAAAYIAEAAEASRDRLQLSGEVSKAIQYVKQHYADNIHLQSVADYVGLSAGYLSNLFKRELHISFIDYLNRYRIERAKELLAETNMKTYDVAAEVGFSPEYTYFSKVFKKVTGINPNEYRRQMQAGDKGE